MEQLGFAGKINMRIYAGGFTKISKDNLGVVKITQK
jgi:hypothetical protein